MGLVKIYNGVKSMFDFDVAEGGTRKNNVWEIELVKSLLETEEKYVY